MEAFTKILVFVIFFSTAMCINDIEITFLRQLYLSTRGDCWHNNVGWELFMNDTSPPTNVSIAEICGANKIPFGVDCHKNNIHILNVRLYDNNLNGTIPATICHVLFLNRIVWIDMSNNSLSGSLPDCILTALNRYKNKDTESEEFSFDLSYNQLSGSLPCDPNQQSVFGK